MATANIFNAENGAATIVTECGDQRVDLPNIPWELYVSINDALEERSRIRVIYAEGRLTFLDPCRKHVWFAGRLGDLVMALAVRLEIDCETAGGATFRPEAKRVGTEGDKTYYFREHAVQMFGPQNIDLATQPPPDLAIEIEVSNPANAALKAWGILGVPEVWRLDPIRKAFGIWIRCSDGAYSEAPTSLAFPGLTSAEVLEQMNKAVELGTSTWFNQLDRWAETVAIRVRDRVDD